MPRLTLPAAGAASAAGVALALTAALLHGGQLPDVPGSPADGSAYWQASVQRCQSVAPDDADLVQGPAQLQGSVYRDCVLTLWDEAFEYDAVTALGSAWDEAVLGSPELGLLCHGLAVFPEMGDVCTNRRLLPWTMYQLPAPGDDPTLPAGDPRLPPQPGQAAEPASAGPGTADPSTVP